MTISEQLTTYCDCSKFTDKDIDELITIISQMTCWNSNDPRHNMELCNTFLNGARREVLDLPSCLKKCPAFYFYPFYYPFDMNSFSFKIAQISGVTETITDLENVSWVESKGAFGIDLTDVIPSCVCHNPCQTCKDEFKLIVEYDAGYEELPECILPVMCNLLNVIEAKNNCDCDDCQACSSQQTTVNPVTGQVTASIQTIKYASGDITTVQLETELARMLVQNYRNQIGLISLCNSPKELWGSVV